MWGDELQAWLIARDSTSFFDLLHNLRYEGHPGLWHLLLYIPAHVSWNPVSMQVINFFIAVGAAWLILSMRRMHWILRITLAFSIFPFYYNGVIARNYMLAMFLLIAASRCLFADKPHKWLAVICLALSLHAHVFAVPVAAMIFIIYFCFREPDSWKTPMRAFARRDFQIASFFLLGSLILAYMIVRPPADVYTPHYDYAGKASLVTYALITEGKTWQLLLPVPESVLPAGLAEYLAPRTHVSAIASLLSLLVLLIPFAALRSKRARIFLASSFLVEIVAMAATVHIPAIRHFGLIFTAIVVAIMADAYDAPVVPEQDTTLRRFALPMLMFCLAIQVGMSAVMSAQDWKRPFSDDKDAALWLDRSGMHDNPIVIEPASQGTSLIGYMQKDKAFYPECNCFGSFILYNRNRHPEKQVTADQVRQLYQTSHRSVLIASRYPLSQSRQTELGVSMVHSFDPHPMLSVESIYIYQQTIFR